MRAIQHDQKLKKLNARLDTIIQRSYAYMWMCVRVWFQYRAEINGEPLRSHLITTWEPDWLGDNHMTSQRYIQTRKFFQVRAIQHDSKLNAHLDTIIQRSYAHMRMCMRVWLISIQ